VTKCSFITLSPSPLLYYGIIMPCRRHINNMLMWETLFSRENQHFVKMYYLTVITGLRNVIPDWPYTDAYSKFLFIGALSVWMFFQKQNTKCLANISWTNWDIFFSQNERYGVFIKQINYILASTSVIFLAFPPMPQGGCYSTICLIYIQDRAM
jgi:hypothetical protein